MNKEILKRLEEILQGAKKFNQEMKTKISNVNKKINYQSIGGVRWEVINYKSKI